MDHALQTISYIADIGPVLVLMARRRLARRTAPQDRQRRLYKMLCHVFHSEDVSSHEPRPLQSIQPRVLDLETSGFLEGVSVGAETLPDV